MNAANLESQVSSTNFGLQCAKPLILPLGRSGPVIFFQVAEKLDVGTLNSFFPVMAQEQATKLLKVNARAPNYGFVMPSFPKGHFADYDPPFGPWEKPDCGPLNMRLAFRLQPL